MSDIIGSIFGTSGSKQEKTTVDPMQQAMNMAKLNQLVNFFTANNPINQYAGPNTAISTPTAGTQQLINTVQNITGTNALNPANILSLDQYRQAFQPITDEYGSVLNRVNTTAGQGISGNYADVNMMRGNIQNLLGQALERNYASTNMGMDAAQAALQRNIGNTQQAYREAIARGDYDYARNLAQAEATRQRALDLGTGAVGNYIDQIARPRLEQQMALMGLEQSGAIPSAVARATAEQAIPYLSNVEQQYAGNTANLGQNLMGLQSQLGGQQLGATAQAGQQYQQNINQLAQALMQGNITLDQAGISADSALGQQLLQAQNSIRNNQLQAQSNLGGQYMGLQSAFAQSLPGASQALTMLPLQAQGQQLQNLNQAAPLLDFPRQLQEADYLRRQNLATTMYTGIPFQSGTQTVQKSGTGNIFDQLGGTISSGVTGGVGGFSTLGTKF